jgi:hypothetical protein
MAGRKLITNTRQLPPPPKLKTEIVWLDELENNGEVPGFVMSELTAFDFGEYQDSLRTHDSTGATTGVDFKHDDLKLLAHTTRDADGNRLWQTSEAAVSDLGRYGKTIIDKLVAASNRVNGGGRSKADQESAEENLDSTQNGSTPSTSPTTSENLTLTPS